MVKLTKSYRLELAWKKQRLIAIKYRISCKDDINVLKLCLWLHKFVNILKSTELYTPDGELRDLLIISQ